MEDVNHAIANLRQMTGISTLDFDAGGNLSLIFDGETPVNLSRIDDGAIELWADVEGIGGASDATVLRRVLEANHLGEGTGAARLALAPGTSGFVLCERVEVKPLSDDQFGARLIEFLKHAAFWNSPEGANAWNSASSGEEPGGGEAFLIRA